jgi:hypothetical protein
LKKESQFGRKSQSLPGKLSYLHKKSIEFFSRITNEIDILLLEIDCPLDVDRNGKFTKLFLGTTFFGLLMEQFNTGYNPSGGSRLKVGRVVITLFLRPKIQ